MMPAARHAFRPIGPGDPEVHDPGVPLAVDHDVLGLEVPVDDAQAVGFGQPFADLFGDGDRLADAQLADLGPGALEVLARDILHRDEVRAVGLPEVVHPADVLVGDRRGRP